MSDQKRNSAKKKNTPRFTLLDRHFADKVRLIEKDLVVNI